MRSSPVRQVTVYVSAATLARSGDAAAGVGIVLLAVEGGPGGAVAGGLLTAALTAPHLLGGLAGRWLDGTADPRRRLAAGCALYAVALAAAVGFLAGGAPWPAAGFLAVAGLCGPLLTGGLSSLATGLATEPGRAGGIDAVTYGLAGTAGPAAVAVLAGITSPAVSLWVVATGVLVAAGLLLRLPAPVPTPARAAAAGPGRFVLLRVRPLRRVTVTTLVAAAVGGALGVLAVLLAGSLTGRPADGAWLMGALGVGTLVGSLGVTVRPQAIEPVRASLVLAAALGVAYLLVAVAPAFPLAVAAFGLVGLLTAPWVTATLRARERYAPAGARGRVFTALAGAKVAAASAGAALAGVTAGLPPRAVLAAGAAMTLAAAAAMALDRMSTTEEYGTTSHTVR